MQVRSGSFLYLNALRTSETASEAATAVIAAKLGRGEIRTFLCMMESGDEMDLVCRMAKSHL